MICEREASAPAQDSTVRALQATVAALSSDVLVRAAQDAEKGDWRLLRVFGTVAGILEVTATDAQNAIEAHSMLLTKAKDDMQDLGYPDDEYTGLLILLVNYLGAAGFYFDGSGYVPSEEHYKRQAGAS